jgi:hypothetical protein
MTTRRLSLVAFLSVLWLGGCASSLPPAQPASDLKSIAGKWECTVTMAGSAKRVPASMTISENGAFETIIPSFSNPGPKFVGSYRVEGGKYMWKSDTSGRTGTATLHEGGGQRVLVNEVPGTGAGYSECVPAKS